MRVGSKIRSNLVYILGVIVIVAVVAFIALSTANNKFALYKKPTIAVLNIEGTIFDNKREIESLTKSQNDPEIKGLIVRVNSPGGAVTSSYELYLAIKRFSDVKPVYVSMSDVAASGGYMISLAANKIYALPTTITGSVGVISETVGVTKLLNFIGIEPRVLKSGKSKDVGSPFRPLNKNDEEIIGGILRDMHKQFIDLTLEHRKIDPRMVSELLDGRVFTGDKALGYGLIDSLGDYYTVLHDLKADLNLPDAQEVEIPPQKNFFERIDGDLSSKITQTVSNLAFSKKFLALLEY